jgi:hypothetical protein
MSSCHTAAVVACRVLGLYIAVQSVHSFLYSAWFLFWPLVCPPRSGEGFNGAESSWMLVGIVLSLAVPVVLAAVVWRLAPWIATKMLVGTEVKQASSSPITLEEFQVVAISILGLLFICEALPGLVSVPLEHLRFLWLEPNASMKSLADAGMVRTLVMGLTKVGLGAWLFLGARSFVRVFQRFRPTRVR